MLNHNLANLLPMGGEASEALLEGRGYVLKFHGPGHQMPLILLPGEQTGSRTGMEWAQVHYINLIENGKELEMSNGTLLGN